MYLFIPKNIKEVYELQEYYDGLILSLENLSINYPEFTLEEIKQIIKEIKNKKIFINLNKNMHNKDIPYLKEIMKEFCSILEGVQVDKDPKMEGKNLTMFLSPAKNK